MNRTVRFFPIAATMIVLSSAPVHAVEPPEADAPPPIEELGDDRYRIGTIVVDKAGQSFTVQGKILHLGEPLEYLAVKTDGAKGYESLLELETSAHQFKLACILVGLDEEKSEKPRFQFDEREAKGQALDIRLSWGDDDTATTLPASSALLAADKPYDDHRWVYIGSVASTQDGSLMAEISGALIGFVHDPMAVIDHQVGAGVGAYGSITGNAELLPPEGSAVTLTVSVVTE